ncbi:MAG: hypothetical protein E7I63_02790 [Citrobacter koseri]|nr:hypothetical protein [Citrobacter koseri]
MNVQGRLTAASLATLALRQGKSPLRGLFALFRLIDFQPEQGHCCNALIFSRTGFAVKKQTAEMVRCGQVRLKIADVFP